MANVRKPSQPVQNRGLWPPPNWGTEYVVLDSDNWWTVAEKFGIGVWDLIEFNFRTRNPEEVNWYLRELVGCVQQTPDRKNYRFVGARATKRKIYIPKGFKNGTKKKPGNKPKPFEKVVEDLKKEIELSDDPRKPRYKCFFAKLLSGADDRVILWNHIAPQKNDVVPPTVRRRGLTNSASAVDPQWLYENIKKLEDVDGITPGWGQGRTKFVTSMRWTLHFPISKTLDNLRWLHDQIVDTHKMLENWRDFPLGGSGSMPREYRAIMDWVRRQEADKKSVLSCVVSSGRPS